MMVNFDFLSEPVDLTENKISVLCIENHQLYRNTVRQFYDSDFDEKSIVFSENYTPLKYKFNICFVPDIFNLVFSNTFTKKIYEDLSVFSNTFLSDEIIQMKSSILDFLEKLSRSYDFDFGFHDEINLNDILKAQNFKPDLNGDLLEKLLSYIITVKKYSTVKCFVLLNIHNYFSKDELELFYKELIYQNVIVLIIENKKSFETLTSEKLYIIDEDFCEIIE